jgi:hypothetical protein
MLTDTIGQAALVRRASVGNLTDESGNHWVCFEHDTVGLVLHSYPIHYPGTDREPDIIYEVLIAGESYEFGSSSITIMPARAGPGR